MHTDNESRAATIIVCVVAFHCVSAPANPALDSPETWRKAQKGWTNAVPAEVAATNGSGRLDIKFGSAGGAARYEEDVFYPVEPTGGQPDSLHLRFMFEPFDMRAETTFGCREKGTDVELWDSMTGNTHSGSSSASVSPLLTFGAGSAGLTGTNTSWNATITSDQLGAYVAEKLFTILRTHGIDDWEYLMLFPFSE